MTHTLRHNGWQFRIDRDTLRIERDGVSAGWFHLAPLIGTRRTQTGPWTQIDPKRFSSTLSGNEGTAFVAVEHGHFCYWFEPTEEKTTIDSVTYFPSSQPTGTAWQSYLSDEHDRLWDTHVDADVQVSSCYPGRHPAGEDGKGMLDPGDFPQTWIWNIPVRCCSLRTEAGWLGVSIPGPLPVGVTRFKMLQRRFSVEFLALRSGCREGQMPKVYFATGLNGPYDALDAHRQISEKIGLFKDKSPNHPQWWSQPLYKYWDEMCRRHKHKHGDFAMLPRDAQGNEITELTTANLLDWRKTVAESARCNVNITLEQGAFLKYGEYTPTESLGGVAGLRKTIDSLREQGTHTALFYHQYHVDTSTRVYQEHPEYFCKPKSNAPPWRQGTPAHPNERLAYIDWTHPKGREYMLGLVEFLVSDKPGCLNGDYLAVNNNIGVDPRYFEFHDPDWGIGDLMQYKVQKLVYERAKRIKPECFVRRQSAADCYMQPLADNNNCCENWFPGCDEWYKRGQIVTRLMPQVIFSADAWFVTLTKNSEYYMSLLVWNVPEMESVTHAIHPYLIYREMQDKHYKRRRSGIQVYLNVPINITDECRVTWNGDGTIEAWRKYTRGPLAGFYAALALSRKALVTYNEAQALVGCAESRFVRVPLPPGARLTSVEMVPHEGGQPRPWPHEVANDAAIEMHVEDCGQEAMYYRIKYSR